MHLSLRLGRTLGELAETLDPHEWDLWLALHAREPLDDTRGDLRAGVIAATVANYAGMRRKDGLPPAQPTDFMPYIDAGEAGDEVRLDPDPATFFARIP